jgi:hypothetical protein
MITRNLSLILILVTLGLSWPVIALAQQSKVIVIAPSDCKPTEVQGKGTVSIHVNAQNILLEIGGNTASCLFTDEALIVIDHKEKTYEVLSYDKLQAINKQQVDAGDKYHQRTGKWLGYNREFRMTDETAIISGLKAHKVIQMIGDKVESEIWVSSESVPIMLRERMKSTYPENYWKKVTLKPWILDIIMLWGVPLRVVGKADHGSFLGRLVVCEARVFEDSISDKAFQVPSGYRRITK